MAGFGQGSKGFPGLWAQPFGVGTQPKIDIVTSDQGGANEAPEQQMQGVAGATPDGRGYVVTPQAMAVEGPPQPEVQDASGKSVTDMVEQPAKVMRIGNMIRQLLEEVKSAPLDEASRQRLRRIHTASIKELEDGLAPELIEELERITLPFTDEGTPTDAELRIAQSSSRCGERYRRDRCPGRRLSPRCRTGTAAAECICSYSGTTAIVPRMPSIRGGEEKGAENLLDPSSCRVWDSGGNACLARCTFAA